MQSFDNAQTQQQHFAIFAAMGRTRPKSKKSKLIRAEAVAEHSQQPSISSLLEKAQTLVVQCDYPLAARFVKRILEREPRHAEARELLAVVSLEMGEIETAKQVAILIVVLVVSTKFAF